MSYLCDTQIEFELVTWKKVLYHMMDENVHFKIRLSEILKTMSDKLFLEKAEKFHKQFIIFDDRIMILRKELSDLDMILLDAKKSENGIIAIKDDLEVLRKNMLSAEKKWSKIRLMYFCDFNKNCV
jgi:hypothetical protein